MTLKLIFDKPLPPDHGSFGLPAKTIRNNQKQQALRWQTYECESCGFEVPMPDDIAELFRERDYNGERNICSTCRSIETQEYREIKEEEESQPGELEPCLYCPEPAQCNGKCWRAILPPRKQHSKQGRLF